MEMPDAEERLKTLEGWAIDDQGASILKSFRFKNFREAFAFMTESALMAEKLDHHPEWTNVYSAVTVRLTTHSADGLTDLDFRLAAAMDKAEARKSA